MTSTGPDRESFDVLGKALSCWGGKFRLVCGHCQRQVRCDLKSGEYMNVERPSSSRPQVLAARLACCRSASLPKVSARTPCKR